MTRRVHVHIGRLVVEHSFDRNAFERALREVVSPSIGRRSVSPVADLRIEVDAGPRRLSGALGSAIGRALVGVAGAPRASASGRPR